MSERAKWDRVYLVCKACGKRSRAPKQVKPKSLVGEIRALTRSDRPRPRVLLTTCMGLCPKGGIAVAAAGSGTPRIAAVASTDDLSDIVTRN